MAGIHIHPHDILDEGTEQILNHIGSIGHITTIFPQVNTIFERNPNPIGSLPHNPVHSCVLGNGTIHVALDTKALYPSLYQKVDETISAGADPLKQFQEASKNESYDVVPWLNLLNGHFEGNVAGNAVIDYKGNPIPSWICPNGPDVVPMWTKVIVAISEVYGCQMFMIDRIRYPDWSGVDVNPKEMFTCFCDHCQAKMQASGIDPAKLVADMLQIEANLKEKQFDSAVQFFQESALIKQWVAFRQASVSGFVEELIRCVQKENPSIRFWLDLWPPAYAWILGQDYHRLTKSAPILKHFPYHKLGGGADVQGLIEYFAKTDAEREKAFQAFRALFGLPYTLTYAEFKQKGYPLQFVRAENDKVRALSQPGTKIYSGIQMWNIDTADLLEAVREARASAADDIIYYCYGWAELKHFETIAQFARQQSQNG